MSRTNHDTPSFPRTLRGPRGGRHHAPTPCVECVGFTSCRPGTCSAPFGCESWVDEDGRRVDVLADLDPQPVDLAAIDEDATEAGRVEFDRLIKEGVDPDRLAVEHGREAFEAELAALDEPGPEPDGGGFTFETMGGLVKGRCGKPAPVIEPDPQDPDPYAPSPATLSEMSGIFPTDDNDPGPLFGGRGSN